MKIVRNHIVYSILCLFVCLFRIRNLCAEEISTKNGLDTYRSILEAARIKNVSIETEKLPMGGKAKLFLGAKARFAFTAGAQMAQVFSPAASMPEAHEIIFQDASIGVQFRITSRFSLHADMDCYRVASGTKQNFTIPIGIQYKF